MFDLFLDLVISRFHHVNPFDNTQPIPWFHFHP